MLPPPVNPSQRKLLLDRCTKSGHRMITEASQASNRH